MRGDYDYNHATSGHQFAVIAIIVIFCTLALGGLFIGLNILDHF
jgi:hypothetical protein